MINARNTYSTENLRPEDFICGFGVDMSLFHRIREKRGITETSGKQDYWLADGTSIDGSPRFKRYHPLLGQTIQNIKNGERGVIEFVGRHWWMGWYWVLLYRKIGTQSHGQLFYKVENTVDKIILSAVEDTRLGYTFENKDIDWDV